MAITPPMISPSPSWIVFAITVAVVYILFEQLRWFYQYIRIRILNLLEKWRRVSAAAREDEPRGRSRSKRREQRSRSRSRSISPSPVRSPRTKQHRY